MRRAAQALTAMALAACGARTELPASGAGGNGAVGAGGSSTASGSCPAPPPAPTSPCTGWVAGSPVVVASPPSSNVGIDMASVLARDCGALFAYYSTDDTGSGRLSWSTRAVGFDGAPLSPASAHPSLSVTTHASASMSLARNGSKIGAAEYDETGCHFVVLDDDGHETSGVASFGADLCSAIAAHGAGFSMLRSSAQGGTPASLELVDALTLQGTATPLPLPSDRAIWDRLVFDDGAFLVDSFREDAATQIYTDWLTPFSADGASTGPEVTVAGEDSAPVWLVPTNVGGLAGWETDSVYVVPIDHHGAQTGTPKAVVTGKTLYGMTLLPVPDGDVLLTWMQLEANSEITLHAMALGPDGVPRGMPSLVANHLGSTRIYGAVESTGSRALLFIPRQDGIEALPLTCDVAGG